MSTTMTELIPGICPTCGDPVADDRAPTVAVTARGPIRACCQAHARDYADLMRRTHHCRHCGTSFQTKTDETAHYCGRKCSTAATRRLAAAWRAVREDRIPGDAAAVRQELAEVAWLSAEVEAGMSGRVPTSARKLLQHRAAGLADLLDVAERERPLPFFDADREELDGFWTRVGA